MNEYIGVNIQDMLKAIGEEELVRLLSDFKLLSSSACSEGQCK